MNQLKDEITAFYNLHVGACQGQGLLNPIQRALQLARKVKAIEELLLDVSSPFSSYKDLLIPFEELVRQERLEINVSLADQSILTSDVASTVVYLTPASSIAKNRFEACIIPISTGSRRSPKGPKTVGAELKLAKPIEKSAILTDGKWSGEPLEPLFANGYGFLNLFIGHPLRPAIGGLVQYGDDTAAVEGPTIDGDPWALMTYPITHLVWLEDSPDDRFNKIARKWLKKHANPVSFCYLHGREYDCFELNQPFYSGLIPSNGKMLDALLKEESRIDASPISPTKE